MGSAPSRAPVASGVGREGVALADQPGKLGERVGGLARRAGSATPIGVLPVAASIIRHNVPSPVHGFSRLAMWRVRRPRLRVRRRRVRSPHLVGRVDTEQTEPGGEHCYDPLDQCEPGYGHCRIILDNEA